MMHEGIENGSIKNLLLNSEWIELDAITYRDGNVVLLEVDFFATAEYQIQTIADTTIDSCVKHARGSFTSLDTYSHGESNHHELFVGSGSSEEHGFILLKEKATGDIKWLAFFRSSSPFRKIVSLNEQQLSVSTEDEMTWTISIEKPDNITIAKQNE